MGSYTYTKKNLEEMLKWVGGYYESEMIRRITNRFREEIKEYLWYYAGGYERFNPRDFGFDLDKEIMYKHSSDMTRRVHQAVSNFLDNRLKEVMLTPSAVIDRIIIYKEINGEPPYSVSNMGGLNGIYFDLANAYLTEYRTLIRKFKIFRSKKFEWVGVLNLVEEKLTSKIRGLEEAIRDFEDLRDRKKASGIYA